MKMKLHKTFLVAALFISVGNIYSMDWPVINRNYVWGNEEPTDSVLIIMTNEQGKLFDAIIREEPERTQQLLEENQHEQNRPLSGFENFLLNFGINWRQPDILASKPFQRFLILTAKGIESDKKDTPHNIRCTLHEYLDVEERKDLPATQ